MPMTVGGAVLGHGVRLTQTNSYGWVALCECGWMGDVVPHVQPLKKETARSARVRELTQSIALDRHAGHLHDVRADIARADAAVLDSLPRLVTAANATLQRRGRWGTS